MAARLLFFAVAASSTVIPRNTIAARDVSSCPGYTASNVEASSNGLTADLSLAGDACDAYGEDLEDLLLEVTYETGKSNRRMGIGHRRQMATGRRGLAYAH